MKRIFIRFLFDYTVIMVYSTKAYAKVNIGLKITGKREDGYHLLSSYFLRIPLYDEIEVKITDGGSVNIMGNETYLDGGEDLMAKAYRLYREKTGLDFGLDIRIKKHIPARAGLGGGSSDASALLRILDDHFCALGDDALSALSISVGADCPFFLSEYDFAYVEGIGEKIEKRIFPSGYNYITLFRGDESGVSTKEAYRALDSFSLDNKPLLKDVTFPFNRIDFPNDFEKIEGCGLLEELKNTIEDGGYLSLSGSGSVWFLLSRLEWRGCSSRFLWTGAVKVD